MQPFSLTEKQIQNGLSDEDFLNAAGFKVVTLSLSDLPFWNLLRNNIKLDDDQRSVRGVVLIEFLESKGIQLNFEENIENTVQLIDGAVTYPGPNVSASKWVMLTLDKVPAKFIENGIPVHHFRTLFKDGLDATLHPLSLYAGFEHDKERQVVLPGVINERADFSQLTLKTEAFVLKAPLNTSDIEAWSRNSGIPQDRLKHYPKDEAHILLADIHELRHLMQIRCKGDHNIVKEISDYYCEIDACLSSHHELNKAGIGKETIRGDRHAHFLLMLTDQPDHWMAPMIDAFYMKRNPPNFFDVYNTGFEITTRLCLEAMGEKHKQYKSIDFKNALTELMIFGARNAKNPLQKTIVACTEIYNKWAKQQFFREPEVFYTLLKRLIRKEAFTSFLSEHTAESIVTGAEYFNPDLTQEQRPESKARLPDNKGFNL